MALITCKDCKKEFSSDSNRCPHCGAKKYRSRYLAKGILVVLFISWMIAHATTLRNTNTNSAPSPSPIVADLGPQWNYEKTKDEMTSKEVSDASIASLNTISLAFPYQGIQRGRLELVSDPRRGKNIIFTIDRGQLLCEIGGCSVTVRFDDAKPERIGAGGAADHDTTTLFLHGYSDFFAKNEKSEESAYRSQYLPRWLEYV